ncbi:hypothetical protein L1987_13604 [Smallanthus sonchifolius]|uniref:Uncharacterized protein n=1 Tax=Smallanthus sonchifolius TaxID=185202 RepID=A0ACB9JHW6_9ASTR|nr:hypothetical protein L1987_13604 [Smallanthus sonchifolius]
MTEEPFHLRHKPPVVAAVSGGVAGAGSLPFLVRPNKPPALEAAETTDSAIPSKIRALTFPLLGGKAAAGFFAGGVEKGAAIDGPTRTELKKLK